MNPESNLHAGLIVGENVSAASCNASAGCHTIASMSAERKAAWILFAIAATEGVWVFLSFWFSGIRFLRYLGFSSGRTGGAAGWAAAVFVTMAFVLTSSRLPSVRQNRFRPSWLKALAFAVAISAGILEEVVFRKWIMDALERRGLGILAQIAASAIAFGALHGVWGLMGRSVRTAVGATVATGALGAALAVVYVLAGRSLAPCVAAHFAINVLIEPGLVLAAVRGEMRPRLSHDHVTG